MPFPYTFPFTLDATDDAQSPGAAPETELGGPVSPPVGIGPMITPFSTPFITGDFSAVETETGTTVSELQTLPVRPMITPFSTPFISGDFAAQEIEIGQPGVSQAGWVPISPMITPFRTPFMSGDASATEAETGGQVSDLRFPLVNSMTTPFRTPFITGDFPGTGIEGEPQGVQLTQGQGLSPGSGSATETGPQVGETSQPGVGIETETGTQVTRAQVQWIATVTETETSSHVTRAQVQSPAAAVETEIQGWLIRNPWEGVETEIGGISALASTTVIIVDGSQNFLNWTGSGAPDTAGDSGILSSLVALINPVTHGAPRYITYSDTLPMATSLSTAADDLATAIQHCNGDFVLVGYSEGAAVCSMVLQRMQSGDLTGSLSSCAGAVMLGNPCRQAGAIAPAQTDPGGHGIWASNLITDTPSWWWEFAVPDDIACTIPDTTFGADLSSIFTVLVNDYTGGGNFIAFILNQLNSGISLRASSLAPLVVLLAAADQVLVPASGQLSFTAHGAYATTVPSGATQTYMELAANYCFALLD